MSLNQQAEREVPLLSGAFDPNYQAKVGLLLNSGGKEVYIWNPEDSMGDS